MILKIKLFYTFYLNIQYYLIYQGYFIAKLYVQYFLEYFHTIKNSHIS